MCIVNKEKNKLLFNNKQIVFENNIETIIKYSNSIVILLMGEVVPNNNIEAFDYMGNKLWDISSIIKFDYPEGYISLSKEDDRSFSTISYNGVKFTIDVLTCRILNQSITK